MVLGLLSVLTVSVPGYAEISFTEKDNQIHFLENRAYVAPSLSIDAFRRELEYEKSGLSIEDRAKNEAQLIAENIHNQIALAFEKAMSELGDEEKASKAVTEAFKKDLELVSPSHKKELLDFSKKSLDQIRYGGVSNDLALSFMEQKLMPSIEQRASILSQGMADGVVPSSKKSKDEEHDNSDQLEFSTHQEFLANLVTNRPSTRWVSTANQNISSGEIVTKEENVSLQVKIDFMGVTIEGGPQINFRREYITNVNIMAEELYPIVLADGNFNTSKRDSQGKIVLKNGKSQRRFLAFSCEAALRFSTEYKGAGGFKVIGMGGGGVVSQMFSNVVTLNTRRVLVPDYISGRTVTMSYLSDLCNRHFLKTQVNDDLTVEQSLNVMMQNVVSGLRFSHPQTKCVVDTNCIDWYNQDVMYIWKLGTYPRCFEEPREKYRACELRGLEGYACPIYRNGKMVSKGKFEIECDKGLKCVQYQEEGFMRFAKGKCEPINKATYRDPRKYPEYKTKDDVIFVDVIR